MTLSESNAKVYSVAAIALLALAVTVTRFYNFLEIPFTYDEYSTLNRANYGTVSELIEYGIKKDAHPAGFQIFIFYLTKFFGESERVVKFPFVLLATCGIFLLYRLSSYCFNRTVAIYTTAIFGLLQFTVMYSQIARPYASGIFFTVALTYVFIRFLNEDIHLIRRTVLIVLLSVLCAYNHYFTMLHAGLMWIVAQFFVDRQKRKYLIAAAVGAFLLYLPHIPIFVAQSAMGGIPEVATGNTYSYWLPFLKYAFQFSWIIIIAAIIVYLLIVFAGNGLEKKSKVRFARLMVFILGVAPFIIGAVYSDLRSPLLTERNLLFSFPFFLLFFFSFLPELTAKKNLYLTIVLLVAMLYSLVYERQHYKLFYTSSFEKVLVRGNETCTRNGLSFISAIDHVENRVYEKFGIEQPCRFLISDSTKISDIRNELEAESYKQIFFGWTTQFFIPPTEIAAVIAEYYPVVVERGEYLDGEYMIFSKSNTASNSKVEEFVPLLNWADKPSQWQVSPELIYQDSLGRDEVRFDNHHDFGMGVGLPIEQILPSSSNWLKASALLEGLDSLSKVVMVVSIERDGETIHWSGKNASDFTEPGKNSTWIHNILRPEMGLMNKDLSNAKLSIYLWNPALENFIVKQFTVSEIRGNSNLYYFNREH